MDDLAFYDYADPSAAITALNLGTVAPRSSADSLLLIYNGSDSYQANDVTVTVTGDDADQLLLSLDGDSFTVSIDVGTIAPNATSPAFYLRRVTPSTAAASGSARLDTVPASWSDPVDISASDNIGLDVDSPPELGITDDPYAPPTFD